ncbi:hypothetical protein BDZ94DRAFT_1284136 [Collybia nuda]|uniref:Uncharacterized protein n=1 Tax=Collybia nuda TaxID=64659 RepID=A0A9P6CBX2_9AGAR|nr:hypothetical protein BDZ94DRAFT_1284136 [Collybia nuda]
MAKTPPFIPRAPLEKLPLATRKDSSSTSNTIWNIIFELLGTPLGININANEVWAYKPPDSGNSPGGLFAGYIEGFISALKSFVEDHGDEGKRHFNEAVSQSQLTLAVNELGDKAETISADVKNGVFRILFHHERFGYNQSYLSEGLLKAIDDVPREGFSIVVKTSIENEYNAEIEDLTSQIGSILAMPDVVLDPNFKDNYAALKVKGDKLWHKNFGKVTFDYFA